MYWYNPVSRTTEDIPDPLFEAQAINLLSADPHSDKFIEEYTRWRTTRDIVDALIFTGLTFYRRHHEEAQSPRSEKVYPGNYFYLFWRTANVSPKGTFLVLLSNYSIV
jgi:hypothetical protein